MRNRQLWLAYPRPTSRNRPSLELPVAIEEFEGAAPYHFNSDFRKIDGTERPWIYASGYRRIQRIKIQTSPGADIIAYRTDTPQIDGKLTEACWDQTNKEQMMPIRFDTPSSYYREYWDTMRNSEGQTDWCFLRSDEENLYAAFFDIPQPDRKGKLRPWRATAEGRDSVRMFGDNFYGLAVTDDRNQQLLVFALSASGAEYDGLSSLPADQDVDPQWDGDWSHGVTADENGFFGEFGIPLKTLRDVGLDPDSLRVNLFSKTDSGAYGVRSSIPPGEFGIKRCQEFVPLGLGKPRAAPERSFRIRLHFAELDNVKPSERVFDVKVQGETLLKDVDIVSEAAARNTALIKEVSGVKTSGELMIEFVPKAPSTFPMISGLELLDESWQPIVAWEKE